MRARISLAIGLSLIAVAIGVVMSRSPPVVARTNGVPIDETVATASNFVEACQGGETLPHGTTAVRLSLEAYLGPRVMVKIVHNHKSLTTGERALGWSRQSVAVPVKSLQRSVANVSLCFAMSPRDETVKIKGKREAGLTGSVTGGRIRIEYLGQGHRSWWRLVPSVVRRMSWGRAENGVWAALAVLVMMVTLTAVVSVLIVRDSRACGDLTVQKCPACRRVGQIGRSVSRRVPLVMWIMLVAYLNAASWSVVTPPFEVTDEPAHFAYVKQLAETGQLPRITEGSISQEESTALVDLHFVPVNEESDRSAIASQAEQERL